MQSKKHKKFRVTKFDVSPKLRLQDAVEWEPKNRKIQYLIDNEPIALWNRIHNRPKNKRKISLVRPVYALLKKRVQEIDPALVEKVNKQHDHHKAIRRLKKEISTGNFGSSNSRFTKIDSRKASN